MGPLTLSNQVQRDDQAMAEYYRSIDDANTYFDDQLAATDWTGATDADKLKALIQAARAIDSLKFRGWKVPVYDALEADINATQATLEAADATQSKQWPRDSDTMVKDTPSTVMTIAAWTGSPTTGTFTIAIKLITQAGVETTITTAAIAYDAAAATIESAIDTAAASVSGWTNGDIAVTGGPLDTAAVTLTFSGSSVSGQSHNERPTISTAGGFDGGTATPPATVAVTGECPDRVFWAQCEEAMHLISGRDPQMEFENAVSTSDGLSSSRITSDRGQAPPVHTAHMFTSALAWKYLAKYLDHGKNNSFNIKRG